MSGTTVVPPTMKAQAAAAQLAREDRRGRRRAKITAPVFVRSMNSEEAFEEIGKTVDVSRNGLLFIGRHNGYEKGQLLEVMFPYSDSKGAQNQAQAAEVVRVIGLPHNKVSVAVHFCFAKTASQKAPEAFAPATNPVAGVGSLEVIGRQKQSIVLAIEPDDVNTEMMRTTLEEDGYTLVIVTSAKEALEYLRTNVPDVFFAELEGGDMSGRDLCALMKKNERLACVPVILTTRSEQPAEYNLGNKLGAVMCLTKPFSSERLQQVVRLVAPPPTSRSVYGAPLSGPAEIERLLA